MLVSLNREKAKAEMRMFCNMGFFDETLATMAFLVDIMERNDR